jgi:hypothetical protein
VRAALITVVLFLAFVAGWPRRIPKMVRGWPPALAAPLLVLPELQAKILAPFAPVAGLLGIGSEDFTLFTGTGGKRYRFWLEGQERTGSWTLLYRAQDPEHAYLAEALEYRRVLNLWNPHHDWISDGYPYFARGLARRVFRDRPEFRKVRLRMEEVTILRDAQGFEPTGKFVYEELVRREEARE